MAIIKIGITGTILVSLALFSFMALTTGYSLNDLKEGLGTPLIVYGSIAFLALVGIAIYSVLKN